MVCAKCQKTIQQTTLATPGVKRKNEMYYGSPGGDKSNPTLSGGISKAGFTMFLYSYRLRNADSVLTEQVAKQTCEESVRRLFRCLRDLQNEDRAGKKILPALRV